MKGKFNWKLFFKYNLWKILVLIFIIVFTDLFLFCCCYIVQHGDSLDIDFLNEISPYGITYFEAIKIGYVAFSFCLVFALIICILFILCLSISNSFKKVKGE